MKLNYNYFILFQRSGGGRERERDRGSLRDRDYLDKDKGRGDGEDRKVDTQERSPKEGKPPEKDEPQGSRERDDPSPQNQSPIKSSRQAQISQQSPRVRSNSDHSPLLEGASHNSRGKHI